MSVLPSCPAFVLYADDQSRRALIRALDETHFTVTFAAKDDEAVSVLQSRAGSFRVAMISVDVQSGRGLKSLEYLRQNRDQNRCAVIVIGDPDPDFRTLAPWADETLLQPVDPAYIAARARTYCNC
jgi:ActR/RegA family two-component response regulator